ncbi:Quinone oxidoreductase PIG3, partial [Fusarium oxysporum f. sp. albedinis]
WEISKRTSFYLHYF